MTTMAAVRSAEGRGRVFTDESGRTRGFSSRPEQRDATARESHPDVPDDSPSQHQVGLWMPSGRIPPTGSPAEATIPRHAMPKHQSGDGEHDHRHRRHIDEQCPQVVEAAPAIAMKPVQPHHDALPSLGLFHQGQRRAIRRGSSPR